MQRNNLLKLYSSAAQQSVPVCAVMVCFMHAFNTICRKLPTPVHWVAIPKVS